MAYKALTWSRPTSPATFPLCAPTPTPQASFNSSNVPWSFLSQGICIYCSTCQEFSSSPVLYPNDPTPSSDFIWVCVSSKLTFHTLQTMSTTHIYSHNTIFLFSSTNQGWNLTFICMIILLMPTASSRMSALWEKRKSFFFLTTELPALGQCLAYSWALHKYLLNAYVEIQTLKILPSSLFLRTFLSESRRHETAFTCSQIRELWKQWSPEAIHIPVLNCGERYHTFWSILLAVLSHVSCSQREIFTISPLYVHGRFN